MKVPAKEIGLTGDASVFDVQMLEPAYRTPAEFAVSIADDTVTLKASHSARIRLARSALGNDWPKGSKPVLTLKNSHGSAAVNATIADDGAIEWQAERGEYELKAGAR